MKKNIMLVLSLLAVISIFIVGCSVPETTTRTITSGDISEEEVAGELNDLDELEEQSNELDDVNFDEAEQVLQE